MASRVYPYAVHELLKATTPWDLSADTVKIGLVGEGFMFNPQDYLYGDVPANVKITGGTELTVEDCSIAIDHERGVITIGGSGGRFSSVGSQDNIVGAVVYNSSETNDPMIAYLDFFLPKVNNEDVNVIVEEGILAEIAMPIERLMPKEYKCTLGEYGFTIGLFLGMQELTITLGTSAILVQKPDGNTETWAATEFYGGQILCYTVADGDLDQIGLWKIKAKVTTTAPQTGVLYGATTLLRVEPTYGD